MTKREKRFLAETGCNGESRGEMKGKSWGCEGGGSGGSAEVRLAEPIRNACNSQRRPSSHSVT